MKAVFEIEKETKNTIKFAEITESKFAAPLIGTLYVPKTTLGQLGYKDGQKIEITVEVAK
jgi:hypothetical protein